MRKKLVCLLLALAIATSICAAAFADDADNVSDIVLLEKIADQEQIYIEQQLSALLKGLLEDTAAFADDTDFISDIALREKISAQEQIYIGQELPAWIKNCLKTPLHLQTARTSSWTWHCWKRLPTRSRSISISSCPHC